LAAGKMHHDVGLQELVVVRDIVTVLRFGPPPVKRKVFRRPHVPLLSFVDCR
jgi:hypothetical protein